MSREADEARRVSLPLGDSFRLGWESVRRRMDRAGVVTASVALSISFMASLMFTDAFYRAHASEGGVRLGVETYQYWLLFVSLAVSVVGIANASLIAVSERYREIGAMKCLGALDLHILQLFLVEALIEGAVGGAVGLALGFVAAILMNSLATGFGVVFRVPPAELLGLVAGPVALSVTLSLAATLYPAYRAARLRPVEALGYEP